MLKDLEQRQSAGKKLPPLANKASKPKSKFNLFFSTKHLYAAFGITLLAASSVTIFIISHQRINSSVVTPIRESVALNAPLSDDDNTITNAITEARIEKLDIKSSDNSTDIIFSMDHESLYEVQTDQISNQVLISFDNASFNSDLPIFDNQISQVDGIRLADNQTGFIINLKKDALLESMSLDKSNDHAELHLRIFNPNIKLEGKNFASAIKKPALSSIIINKYKTALHTAELGKTDQAVNSLTRLLKQFPDYNDARVSLIAILMENKKLDQAEKVVNEGLIIDPDYVPLVELKAHVLNSRGKKKEALALLQREQPLITDYPEYHAFIAALYSQEDNHKLAANIYKRLVKINPHEGAWWFGLGVSLDKLGNNKEAVTAYTKAATEGRLNDSALAFLQTRMQALQGGQNVAE